MKKEPRLRHDEMFALRAELDALELAIADERSVVAEKLPELRRQARADPKRRGRDGTDTIKYALGSVLVMLDCVRIDSAALIGLFANPDLMLRWMVEARQEHGPLTFAEMVAAAMADAQRYAWCKQWGICLQWRHRKNLYDASVTSFIESGRAGPREKWRRDDVSDDQADLIVRICGWLEEPLPDLSTKGEAFEWIYERGGNPTYWAEPQLPAEWR